MDLTVSNWWVYPLIECKKHWHDSLVDDNSIKSQGLHCITNSIFIFKCRMWHDSFMVRAKNFKYIMSQTNFPVDFSTCLTKPGTATERLLRQRKVFLMKYFSSSAVQKEPTQSPIQGHSSGYSPLCNRLCVNHHWRPSPGWILWSGCEYLYRVFTVFHRMNSVFTSSKMKVLLRCFLRSRTQTEPCLFLSSGSLSSCLEFTTYE